MPDLAGTMRWLADVAARHWAQTYSRSIDLDSLRNSETWGRKLFLQYARTRQGAPHALEVAGIKALAASAMNGQCPSECLGRFYHGGLKDTHNPFLDVRFSALDVPGIVRLVEQGDLRAAFNQSRVRGANHKIVSLFLRDIAIEIGAESRQWTITEQYLFSQPIDEWARAFALRLPELHDLPVARPSHYGLPGKDLRCALSLIEHALASGVSPLLVSRGVWYFARNVVADLVRLRALADALDPAEFQSEMDLLNGFLP